MTRLPVTPVACVTPADAEAAARIDPTSDDFSHLLFSPPRTGPAAQLQARDYAAAGTVLTFSRPLSDRLDNDEQLLRVIRAVGRIHHRGTASFMPTGVVMLAGEIAARTLHRELTAEHGPYAFEPFTAAIAILWRLPGESIPPVQGDPGMALYRLTTGLYGSLLSPQVTEAARLLATARPHPGGQAATEHRLLCVARICAALLRHRGPRHLDELPAVRESVLTARDTRTPGRRTAKDSAGGASLRHGRQQGTGT